MMFARKNVDFGVSFAFAIQSLSVYLVGLHNNIDANTELEQILFI